MAMGKVKTSPRSQDQGYLSRLHWIDELFRI